MSTPTPEQIAAATTYLGIPTDDPDYPYEASPQLATAIADADTTAPPPGIDRQTWGQQTEHDRLEIAKFAAFLRSGRVVVRKDPQS